jgi:MFS family permease
VTSPACQDSPAKAAQPRIPRSAYFALFVLVLANLFNMLDRSIVSILAQSIKADLKLDDADLGFLLGTAFAVFYSIVGTAMGRISDFVSRKKMLAVGLALWSVMTAMVGAAIGFATLSAARIGVGVGEAVANPCSHSLLTDVFPARNRALALGTYLTGTFFGTASAMIVGGLFVQKWPDFCSAVPFVSACGLAGWKAALIAVGLPGLAGAARPDLARTGSPEDTATWHCPGHHPRSGIGPAPVHVAHDLSDGR